MKTMLFKRPAAAVAATVLLAATFWTGSPQAQTKPPIVVSEVVMLTGNIGFFGTELDRGGRIALEQVNAAGGANGAKIEVRRYDTESNKDKALRAAERAIKDKQSVAIMAMTATFDQLAWVPEVQEGKVPLLSNSVAGAVPAIGNYIFQVAPPDATLIPNFVQNVATKLSLKTVAYVRVANDPSVESSYKGFKAAFDAAGVRAVSDEQYLHADTEWSSQFVKVKRANPDIVVIIPYAQEGGSLLKQARQAGITTPVIGGSPLNSTDALKQAGPAGDNLYVPDFWAASETSENNKFFAAEYRKQYNQAPTRFAATGYNMMRLLTDALSKAKDPQDRNSVRDALATINKWQYLGCEFTMKDRVPVCGKPAVLKSEGGNFVLVP